MMCAKVVFEGACLQGSYTITLSDPSGRGGGSFPMCYAEGDINCDGVATGLDIGVVKNGANWLKDLSDPNPRFEPRADVNRDGFVTGIDIGTVKCGGCWLRPNPPATCACPG